MTFKQLFRRQRRLVRHLARQIPGSKSTAETLRRLERNTRRIEFQLQRVKRSTPMQIQLRNIGEILETNMSKPKPIPDLSNKFSPIKRINNGTTIIVPMTINDAHKIVCFLAKTARCEHRCAIGKQTEISLASIGPVLAKLEKNHVINSPQPGYYVLAKNFLKKFQLTYGNPSTEKLFKMMEEEGIDLSQYEVVSNNGVSSNPPATPNNETSLTE